MNSCTRSLALGTGAFVLVLTGAVLAPAMPAAGLALMAAGMLTYAAARAYLNRC